MNHFEAIVDGVPVFVLVDHGTCYVRHAKTREYIGAYDRGEGEFVPSGMALCTVVQRWLVATGGIASED